MTDEPLLTVSDAARIVGLAASTFRYHCDAGRIPCVRSSRGDRMFKRADVIQFRNARHQGARRRS